jgi:hypothetical protein
MTWLAVVLAMLASACGSDESAAPSNLGSPPEAGVSATPLPSDGPDWTVLAAQDAFSGGNDESGIGAAVSAFNKEGLDLLAIVGEWTVPTLMLVLAAADDSLTR